MTSRRGQNRGGSGGGFMSGLGRNISQYISEPENSTNNTAGRNVEEPPPLPPPVPGLAELVEVLTAMGASPTGVLPQINQDLLEKIRNSPLEPVVKVLQPIYRKLGPPDKPAEQSQRSEANQPSQSTSTPGPDPSSTQQPPPPVAPNGTEIKNLEAGLQLLSSKLDFVVQTVGDVATNSVMSGSFGMLEGNLRKVDSETRDAVNTSATASKKQIEAVDTKISQMSGKLDPTLHDLSQGIKRLQVGLVENAKADKTRLETKVNDLEKEVKELQQVIDATRTELLPVEAASKMALQGTLSEEADKAGPHKGAGNNTGNASVVQTAKRVRANTSGIIAKCRALLTFINRDPTTGSNVPDLGTEGEWGRCAEHLKASNTRLRSVIEEKEESAQKLQFVGFVVDQIRKGRYTEDEWKSDLNGKTFVTLIEKSPDGFASIQMLVQDLSRLTAAAKTAPVAPVQIAPVNGKPPGYGTPPPTPAANDSGASTAKPGTGGTKGREKGKPSNNASPSNPTGSKPPAGSRGATPRATATNSRTPAEHDEPVEPVAPLTSTPVVTAPTSPAIATVHTPPKHHSEIRPDPPKKSSSGFRSKSEFRRRPVSGWGLISG